MIRKFLFLLFCFCVSNLYGATYYCDDANGNDANPGTSEQPWKTIARSYPNNAGDPNVDAGDTVYIRDGGYGNFYITNYTGESWINYIAALGHSPSFNIIKINNTTKQNVYIKFDGLKVLQPLPDPMPPDDGYRHFISSCIELDNADYMHVKNCLMKGAHKYLTLSGIDVTNCDNLTVERCEIDNVVGGTNFLNSKNLNFIYNYIHNTSEISGVRLLPGGSTGAIIEGNHICDCHASVNDDYFPHLSDYHRGSGVAIRVTNVVVRNNIIHDGYAQALMIYHDWGPYHNMIIENNLFYDTKTIALYECGNNVIIRNNNFIGSVVVGSIVNKYKILQRYGGVGLNVYLATGYNGSEIEIYNNIFVTKWGISATNPIKEDYNISWNYGGTVGYPSSKGEHTAIMVYLLTHPWGKDLHGYPNCFEDIGFRGALAEYSYSVDGIQPFFINPGFYFGAVGNYQDCHKIWDYRLAEGSPGINFGTTQLATYTEVINGTVTGPSQPPDSLGTLDPNGFLRNDGISRNASRHSAGCYEYQGKYFIVIKE